MDIEEEEIEHGGRRFLSINKTKVVVVGISVVVILVVISSLLVTISLVSDKSTTETASKPNIIFMISDGLSPTSETFARTMDPSQPLLELDTMLVGMVRTFSSSSLITDSAAGATAYACGLKTYNGAIAVNDDIKAQGTAMEAAKRLGWKTALVTTSRITHATPASFSSHMSDRDFEDEIAYQQANDQDVDLLFGGGLAKYTNRPDQINLLDTMSQRGYQTITSYTEFRQQLRLPVIGLFAEQHMDYEIDRMRQDPVTQPSLVDMVTKALGLLEEAQEPFFLMIEGARIDMAGHNHDAYAHYLDIMQYQKSVGVVKEFVARYPNTYVVSVADHGTGGMSLGMGFLNGSYPEPYQWFPNKLKNQTASTEWMSELILDNGIDTLNQTVETYCGFTLTDEEYTFIMNEYQIADSQSRGLRTAIGTVASARALIAWTTPGHVGVDVNLYAYGKKAQNFGGLMDNIDVGYSIWDEVGLVDTMNQITTELSGMTFPDIPGEHKKDAMYLGHN